MFKVLFLTAVASLALVPTQPAALAQDRLQEDPITDDRLDVAISRAVQVIDKGVASYPEHRSCFSCHHQTLPLMAKSVGSVHHAETRTAFYDHQQTRDVLDFTERAFSAKKVVLNAGGDIGGKALTVAYGLWALDLSGAPASETTQAMVEYLLKTQAEDGAWCFHSLRPPAASSRAMTSAVAIYGLRSYGQAAVDAQRLQSVYQRTVDWLQRLGQPDSHEELIGQVWLEQMLSEELGQSEFQRSQNLEDRLWRTQREDGGWAQTADLPSDAYATGQALLLLAEIARAELSKNAGATDASEMNVHTKPDYRRGVQYLLDTQHPDGSWLVKTRSKPVQVFFDNGDPHGEHQFISMMATCWATAALREFKYQTGSPLASPRVTARLADQKSSKTTVNGD